MDDYEFDNPLISISESMLTQEPDPTVPLVVTKNTTEPTTKVGTQAVVEHECFSILSGRGKGGIGTKNERIKLIHDVLQVDASEYVPPHLTYDPLLKGWLKLILILTRTVVNGNCLYLQEQNVVLTSYSQIAEQMLQFQKIPDPKKSSLLKTIWILHVSLIIYLC